MSALIFQRWVSLVCLRGPIDQDAKGRTGLGAERRAWMDRRTVRIWSAGDHLSVGSQDVFFKQNNPFARRNTGADVVHQHNHK